ncbi:ABC transporter ATP-binding protein [Rhabdothermincola sp.]|uniref:ABC transporter ATP-binding protein n=1 Tax=Rhabdothermincola sp. TaxID=2820405 RepID=UPI002FE2543F
METSALQLSGVGVDVRDGDETLTILDGVDLSLERGQLVVITGRSGSGKSTLLSVAGLLRRPSRGEVIVAGQPTSALGVRQRTRLRRDHVAFVHQSAQLFPSLRAVEQLELVAHIHGRLDRAARRRARDLLGELGLGDRLHHLPSHLSGGERQRVAIGRALMGQPSVVLADEPTAALDPERSRQIMEALAQETRQRKVATLVVIHDPAQLDLADRRLELRDHRLHDVTVETG